jgi:cytochrome c oxidase subunit 2
MIRIHAEQASSFAENVDFVHDVVTIFSVFFTILVTGVMIYFAVRYRQRNGKDHATPQILHSNLLEIVWTIIPILISIYVAYLGIIYYQDMRTPSKDALVINVTGQKWFWDFKYPNGKSFSGKDVEFVVPVNKPVQLVMTSRDVLHSFFIPAMRVKKDAVPGMYSYINFTPIKTGTYQVFCTEYCGKEHYNMMVSLKVVSEAEYERWVNDTSDEFRKTLISPAEIGKALYTQKGCNACHSLDGSRLVGPTWLNLYGNKVKLDDGSEVLADDNYLKTSILEPGKQLHATYANLMPSYQGQLDDEEISAMIAFVREQTTENLEKQKAAAPKKQAEEVDESKLSPAERGERLFKKTAVPSCLTCHSLDGSKLVGPSVKGIYGRSEKMSDGSSIIANDEYIKESILNPSAKLVEGYPAAMPPYAGQLNDQQLADLIEYFKTLK